MGVFFYCPQDKVQSHQRPTPSALVYLSNLMSCHFLPWTWTLCFSHKEHGVPKFKGANQPLVKWFLSPQTLFLFSPPSFMSRAQLISPPPSQLTSDSHLDAGPATTDPGYASFTARPLSLWEHPSPCTASLLSSTHQTGRSLRAGIMSCLLWMVESSAVDTVSST